MTNPKRSTISLLLRSATLALLGAAPLSAMACGPEPYVGTVCTVSFNWCPQGYLPADGRQLSVNDYQLLFALIGYRYGGNNTTLFNLPDLRGRAVVGVGVSDYGSTTVLAQKGGAAAANLSANNLPAHVHPATSSLGAGSVANGPLTLPVTGGTVTGQTISGSVTVNALNGANPPTSGTNIPTSTANSVGKVGTGQVAFYPQGSNPIAVPSTHNLTVSGGAISGATASGTVKLPANPVTVPVTVGPNTPTQPATIATISPNLGQNACIAVQGLYPQQP